MSVCNFWNTWKLFTIYKFVIFLKYKGGEFMLFYAVIIELGWWIVVVVWTHVRIS